MAITNIGTVDINSLVIIVEIFDPDEQKVEDQNRVNVIYLREKETRNITISLRVPL
ncbi:MAG: hypothetical protein LUP99_04500 [Methanomicrobiales archaeon]|nr:hypothetical protein [Methanomicrobiales archaeon]